MAQTQLYTKKSQVFVIEETSQDTYLAQTAASAILAEIGDSPYTIDGSNYEPTTVRGDFLTQDEVPGAVSASCNFRVPLHGDGGGTAGVAPEFNEALKACGYEEVVVGATSVTYSPRSSFTGVGGLPGPSYSVTVLTDGLAYQMKGAFGNVVFEGAVGEPIFANFTFTGAHHGVADDALESTTYDVGVSPPFRGASFSVDHGSAYPPVGIQNFNLDTGNNVVAMSDVNDANGFYGARIIGRKSVGSFDPEMVLAATHDYEAIWAAGTVGSVTTGLIGSTASNQYTITAARVVRRPPEFGSRDGVATLTVPFAVSSAGTDTEGTELDITLAFT